MTRFWLLCSGLLFWPPCKTRYVLPFFRVQSSLCSSLVAWSWHHANRETQWFWIFANGKRTHSNSTNQQQILIFGSRIYSALYSARRKQFRIRHRTKAVMQRLRDTAPVLNVIYRDLSDVTQLYFSYARTSMLPP